MKIKQTSLKFILLVFLASCAQKNYDGNTSQKEGWQCSYNNENKMNGVSLVAMPYSIDTSHLSPVNSVGANWIAITPFSFIKSNGSTVYFDTKNQWYGETIKGTEESILAAQQKGLKILLKPHIWIWDKWVGELNFSEESDWLNFEQTYTNYIVAFAKLAQSHQVEMFCVGVELRHIVKEKPQLFNRLIDSVKKVYSGKITYAANWDNYQHVTFWDKLDYIGIDAYFPLTEKKNPSYSDFYEGWKEVEKKLKSLSEKENKEIIFTEFGYRNIDYSGKEPWIEGDISSNNLTAQSNALEAILCRFWQHDWFKGGILWKWYPKHASAGGENNNQFTPQNKPAQKVIEHYYNQ